MAARSVVKHPYGGCYRLFNLQCAVHRLAALSARSRWRSLSVGRKRVAEQRIALDVCVSGSLPSGITRIAILSWSFLRDATQSFHRTAESKSYQLL
ncbi:MAG: hypothetical protein KME08_00565 [Aphanothece sp. CMT-3BRIN-NPC111]|nr:hypothetical protein [Aphanothece sp. CMT-3BRIN-NPC111]